MWGKLLEIWAINMRHNQYYSTLFNFEICSYFFSYLSSLYSILTFIPFISLFNCFYFKLYIPLVSSPSIGLKFLATIQKPFLVPKMILPPFYETWLKTPQKCLEMMLDYPKIKALIFHTFFLYFRR
jgi:hypothetical protein